MVRKFVRAVDLMEADVGDELVALDPAEGACFGFNSVATFVWRSLELPRTFEELHNALLAEYDVAPEQCERELRDLLNDLQAKHLITADR